MADFTVISLDANIGNTATPTYSALGGANTEWRWTDSNAAGVATTPSATWPAMIRPGSGTLQVPYAYAFTADAVGQGIYSGATADAATFATTQFLQARWTWDGTGDFASVPIMTAYDTSGHNSPTVRGTPTGGILAGSGDTGNRSYVKATLFGQLTPVPAAGPATPLVTDAANGAVVPTAGANWSAWQGLMADLDYLQFAAEPAVGAASLHCMIALFTGVNMSPGTLQPLISLKYTFT